MEVASFVDVVAIIQIFFFFFLFSLGIVSLDGLISFSCPVESSDVILDFQPYPSVPLHRHDVTHALS